MADTSHIPHRRTTLHCDASGREPHGHPAHHGVGHGHQHSRREFLSAGVLAAGAALLNASMARAALARAQASRSDGRKLFDLEKVADGVYAALARPQAMINSNAAIFVNKRDVLVVDSHSKPSAVAALVAQLRREVTALPVRYVVNSHFHWDHMQGNSGYREQFPAVKFVASEATHNLMAGNSESRLKIKLAENVKLLDDLRSKMSKATDQAERAFYQDQVAQIDAFQTELSRFSLELPDITFSESLLIHDEAHTLALSFQGRAHTAGDVAVFCPERKAVATGDALIGFPPFMADGYPKEWPATLGKLGSLEFDSVIPGHGFVDNNRLLIAGMRGYITELTERVSRGREQGKKAEELQQEITVESLHSLTGSYLDLVHKSMQHFMPWYGTPPSLGDAVRTNVGEVYSRLDAA